MMQIRLTKKAQKELGKYEQKFPGKVFIQSATRNRARVLVGGIPWEFVVEEEELLLTTKMQDRTYVPDELYRLAFWRALEAIAAVRTGHRDARAARQAARTLQISRGDLRGIQETFKF